MIYLIGVDSGIGAGVDSFYEYLVKGSIMLNRPELMEIFNDAKSGIDKYLSKNDWHIWASMTKGQVTIPVFQSLGINFNKNKFIVKRKNNKNVRIFYRCILARCFKYGR